MRTPKRCTMALVLLAAAACAGRREPRASGTGGATHDAAMTPDARSDGGISGAGGATNPGTGGASGTGGAGGAAANGGRTGGGAGGSLPVGGAGGGAPADGGAAGGTAGNGGVVGPITTAPWPERCVPAANLDRPARAELLTGPAGSSGFGEAARPGEVMTARLNGLLRSFSRFEVSIRGSGSNGVVGYGFDGSIGLTIPTLAVGTIACPAGGIAYANLAAGSRDSNAAASQDCCSIQITRVGAVGELIEGTFTGILVHQPLQSWIKVEDGRFAVVRR